MRRGEGIGRWFGRQRWLGVQRRLSGCGDGFTCFFGERGKFIGVGKQGFASRGQGDPAAAAVERATESSDSRALICWATAGWVSRSSSAAWREFRWWSRRGRRGGGVFDPIRVQILPVNRRRVWRRSGRCCGRTRSVSWLAGGLAQRRWLLAWLPEPCLVAAWAAVRRSCRPAGRSPGRGLPAGAAGVAGGGAGQGLRSGRGGKRCRPESRMGRRLGFCGFERRGRAAAGSASLSTTSVRPPCSKRTR